MNSTPFDLCEIGNHEIKNQKIFYTVTIPNNYTQKNKLRMDSVEVAAGGQYYEVRIRLFHVSSEMTIENSFFSSHIS
jgi:hypothetical protein